jgi:hypothetical protein
MLEQELLSYLKLTVVDSAKPIKCSRPCIASKVKTRRFVNTSRFNTDIYWGVLKGLILSHWWDNTFVHIQVFYTNVLNVCFKQLF